MGMLETLFGKRDRYVSELDKARAASTEARAAWEDDPTAERWSRVRDTKDRVEQLEILATRAAEKAAAEARAEKEARLAQLIRDTSPEQHEADIEPEISELVTLALQVPEIIARITTKLEARARLVNAAAALGAELGVETKLERRNVYDAKNLWAAAVMSAFRMRELNFAAVKDWFDISLQFGTHR